MNPYSNFVLAHTEVIMSFHFGCNGLFSGTYLVDVFLVDTIIVKCSFNVFALSWSFSAGN